MKSTSVQLHSFPLVECLVRTLSQLVGTCPPSGQMFSVITAWLTWGGCVWHSHSTLALSQLAYIFVLICTCPIGCSVMLVADCLCVCIPVVLRVHIQLSSKTPLRLVSCCVWAIVSVVEDGMVGPVYTPQSRGCGPMLESHHPIVFSQVARTQLCDGVIVSEVPCSGHFTNALTHLLTLLL